MVGDGLGGENLLALVGEACRDILYRCTLVEEHFEDSAHVDLFKFDLCLHKIHRTPNASQIDDMRLSLGLVRGGRRRDGLGLELQTGMADTNVSVEYIDSAGFRRSAIVSMSPIR